MRIFLMLSVVSLTPLSLIAGLTVRRKIDESNFSSNVVMVDVLFAFVGFVIIALANASATNPFAKYQEGFPHVDKGGLPLDVILGNLLIFATPLIALGLGRVIRRAFERIRKNTGITV